MVYVKPDLNGDEDLRIMHDALFLKWASLTKQIQGSNDQNNVKFFCRQLIRVIELIMSMEDLS